MEKLSFIFQDHRKALECLELIKNLVRVTTVLRHGFVDGFVGGFAHVYFPQAPV